MGNPSASNLYRLYSCQWAYRDDVEYPPDTRPKLAAELGSAFHEVAEGVSIEQAIEHYPSANREDLELLVGLHAAWWQHLSDKPWILEKAFAWDVVSGTVRECERPTRDGHRYVVSDTEVPGTIDLLLVKDDRVLVGDLKTGRGLKTIDEYIDQLEFGALCAARFYGKSQAKVFVNHVTPEATAGKTVRLKDGTTFEAESGVLVTSKSLDESDFKRVEDKLRQAVLAIRYSRPIPGDHCQWCPAKAVCPTSRESFAAMGPPTSLVRPGYNSGLIDKIRTPEEATKLYDFVARAKGLVDHAEAMLKDYATNVAPVDLGNGKEWGPVERTTEYINLDAALPVLKQTVGDGYSNALDMKITKASIRRMFEAQDKPGAAKKTADVLTALAESGAIGTRISTVMMERKSNKKLTEK